MVSKHHYVSFFLLAVFPACVLSFSFNRAFDLILSTSETCMRLRHYKTVALALARDRKTSFQAFHGDLTESGMHITDMVSLPGSLQMRRLCQWSSERNFTVLIANLQRMIYLVACMGSMNVSEQGVVRGEDTPCDVSYFWQVCVAH